MNKGFGDNNKNNKNFLVKDIELASQTKKAIILAREGNFLESAKIYNDLIYKKKFNHLTFHRLAGIYEKLGKRKEAFECLQKAIKLFCQSATLQAQFTRTLHKYWKYLYEVREPCRGYEFLQKVSKNK